ncbi:hypothetical protein [Photorhabdus bodei]|uniref:Uncharacterized protein n=1 Tax=Photorhabdus bodei TaxID=2029681 RepID=A0AAW6BMU3_9GAMM|nr:hypothetical protein [Photorhabdus bodei]MDB6373975.1 hypothetical protein [Photorhabdus bodei]
MSGGYNPCTGQREFAVSFSSNSPAELHLKLQMVEFTLRYLKVNDRNEKTISIFNLPNEDCAWSLVSNQTTGKFGLVKEIWGARNSFTEFDSLLNCLSYIQSLSDTDIIPESQLLANKRNLCSKREEVWQRNY